MGRVFVSREGIGSAAVILQKVEVVLARVVIDQPSLLFVSRGAKSLRADGRELTIRAGEGAALDAGQAFDIVNHPDAEGLYEARWLSFDPALAVDFEREARSPEIRDALLLHSVEEEFLAAYQRALDAVGDPQGIPHAIAAQRLRECLTWIDIHGGRFAGALYQSASARVRSLLLAAPEKPWSAADVSRELAMSEATLRRRLASEGASFSSILRDVRLSQALTLLQATDRSIEEIALAVGYESASRFAVRFRQRFGHAPGALRGQRRPRDRFGTKINQR